MAVQLRIVKPSQPREEPWNPCSSCSCGEPGFGSAKHSRSGRLRGAGVTQVILGGVATSIGVEATARSVYDEGFHVVLVTDAMTDAAQDVHDHSSDRHGRTDRSCRDRGRRGERGRRI
jgi:nicotinamidase-related amidase